MGKVQIPNYISEYINLFQQHNCKLVDAIRAPFFFKYFDSPKINKIRKWLLQDRNSEMFAQAWINGCELEKVKM